MLTLKQHKDLLEILHDHYDRARMRSQGVFVTENAKAAYEEIMDRSEDLIAAVKAEIECLNILKNEGWTPPSTPI